MMAYRTDHMVVNELLMMNRCDSSNDMIPKIVGCDFQLSDRFEKML